MAWQEKKPESSLTVGMIWWMHRHEFQNKLMQKVIYRWMAHQWYRCSQTMPLEGLNTVCNEKKQQSRKESGYIKTKPLSMLWLYLQSIQQMALAWLLHFQVYSLIPAGWRWLHRPPPWQKPHSGWSRGWWCVPPSPIVPWWVSHHGPCSSSSSLHPVLPVWCWDRTWSWQELVWKQGGDKERMSHIDTWLELQLIDVFIYHRDPLLLLI